MRFFSPLCACAACPFVISIVFLQQPLSWLLIYNLMNRLTYLFSSNCQLHKEAVPLRLHAWRLDAAAASYLVSEERGKNYSLSSWTCRSFESLHYELTVRTSAGRSHQDGLVEYECINCVITADDLSLAFLMDLALASAASCE